MLLVVLLLDGFVVVFGSLTEEEEDFHSDLYPRYER